MEVSRRHIRDSTEFMEDIFLWNFVSTAFLIVNIFIRYSIFYIPYHFVSSIKILWNFVSTTFFNLNILLRSSLFYIPYIRYIPYSIPYSKNILKKFNSKTFIDYNDLWKFDGNNWAWMSGYDGVDQKGTYGTRLVASAANVPGARNSPVTWTDSSNGLWMYGGTFTNGSGYFCK